MTPKQKINFFKKVSQKFISYFGLYNWETYFKKETEIDNRASCETQIDAKIAKIFYDEDYLKEEQDLDEIAKTSFHEIMEIILSELREMASNRDTNYTEREIEEKTHTIIKIFENRVFDKIWKEIKDELKVIKKKNKKI